MWVRSEARGGSVEVRISERITGYRVEGHVDPLPAALRGDAPVSLELVCTTACLSSSLGGPGEALRRSVGPTARIHYQRHEGREELRVDGVEALLESEGGQLRLRGVNASLQEKLEKCLLHGASLLSPRLEELLAEGIDLGGYRVYQLGGHLLSLIGNPLAAEALPSMEPKGGCVEEIVSGVILEALSPLAAAAAALSDYLERSIIAYPVREDALYRLNARLGDYGEGLAPVLSKHPREASVIASKLLGASVEVDAVRVNGVSLPVVRVESETLTDVHRSPLVALSLSIAASILSKRSVILAIDAPVDKLDRAALVSELERSNAVLLYSRF